MRRPKPRKRFFTTWKLGQVFRYRLGSGRTCLFRVVDFYESKSGRSAEFEVLAAGRNPFAIAFARGLRDNEGKPRLIVVVEGALESNPRIAATSLGESFLAPLMLKLRRSRERREFPRGSFMVVDKLDLNLQFLFGLD